MLRDAGGQELRAFGGQDAGVIAETGSADRPTWLTVFSLIGLAAGTSLLFIDQLSDVLGEIPWFLRTYAAIIGPCEVAAALLLAWRAVALRTRRSALLAAAYAWSAPLVLENLASLPGIFRVHGAFGHQTPPWCWLAWHAGWALCIAVFTWIPDRPVRHPLAIVGAVFTFSLAFGYVAFNADAFLPAVLGPGDTNTTLLLWIGWSTVACLVVAGIGLAIARDTTIDAFVLVAVVALALDETFVLTSSVRFSLGTYLARTLGAINALTVLVAFAVEFGALVRSERGSLLRRLDTAAAIRRDQTLRHVAQALPQLVWIAEPDGRVEWYNRRWFEYTGQSPELAARSGWLAVQHPDDVAHAQRWPASARSGVPVTIESRLRAADGSYHWFLTRFEPMRDAAQRSVKWYASATNIELRRRRTEP